MPEPVKKSFGNLKGPGPGRPKGMANKTTTQLKEAILEAADKSGSDGQGRDGLVGYLFWLSTNEASSFASLLGKVLPHTIAGDPNAPLRFERIERVIVDPANPDA